VISDRSLPGGREPATAESVDLLRCVPILLGIDPTLLERMAGEVELVSLAHGEWLFRSGDRAECAFVVASGRIDVLTEEPVETVLREVRRGGAFGELALLTGGARTASARARRDCTLIRLRREVFEGLLRDSPEFAVALTRTIGTQLASTQAPSARPEPPRTIAVAALDAGARSALEAAAEALRDELASWGTCGCFMQAFSNEPGEWPARLSEAEIGADRVVLFAGATDPRDAWTAFCLREADLHVLLCSRSAPARWNDVAKQVGGCELVVLGSAACAATVERLAARIVRAVKGQAGVRGAMQDLGRRLCGRSVGLVLSGGGARAFAHAGVVAELTEAGVRLDRIAGVSLGALAAAALARGDPAESLFGALERYFIRQHPTRDYTLPLVSLIRGRRAQRLLDDEFGDLRIEALPIPFYCTSVDLLRRRLVVHRTGRVADALLASISIPGVFPPVLDSRGRLLVDGGVLDNLPVSVDSTAREGPTIAVEAGGLNDDGRDWVGHSPPLRGLLRRVITGHATRLPPLPETIVRCMTLGSADTSLAARRHADLLIAPTVAGIGLLDWRRLPDMHAAGAAAAREALDGCDGDTLSLLRGE
jgi:predicted acylesterase/phospholipase RssA/CRP-like cAMP-binding protein